MEIDMIHNFTQKKERLTGTKLKSMDFKGNNSVN